MASTRKGLARPRPIIENTLQAQGIQVLYVVPFPGMGMVSKKPINRLADLKGMRFRSFGPAASRFGELVGATPTVIQASELSQAFTVGAIDSTLTSASTERPWPLWSRTTDRACRQRTGIG